MEPSPKRRRLSYERSNPEDTSPLPLTLRQPISPPRTKRSRSQATPVPATLISSSPKTMQTDTKVFKSPFQLTWIRDLPDAANADAVTLRDILGDPLIAECWNFNYLHDIDFLMAQFHRDVRDTVQVNVVHGFWKKEDPSRQRLQEGARPYKNVALHCAYMPEFYGTHHCKMLILLRHDDTAQVVIHTANMIPTDWTNMTQAVWRSPLLPLSQYPSGNVESPVMGTGDKFKTDLLNYLSEYNQKRNICRALVEKLGKHDFTAVRAALIASVPGRHNIRNEAVETRWGWPALKHALRAVPVQKDAWLRKSLFDSLKTSQNTVMDEPEFKVVFPTADEIRRSLNGYESGGSIHTRIQSTQQAKQLLYTMPMFCHWANEVNRGRPLGEETQEAGRKRAAPHIKTYVRYGEKSIDWALTTSANLSKQAWGESVDQKSGEVRIASWEIGVLVWPALFAHDAKMVGTFQIDTPDSAGEETPVVGLRIPYNLPLQSYGEGEKPWVATMSHHEPDWKGQRWVL